ncbi:hypothetical protein QTO34_005334, partial [Cnephaeus nilssonii]
MKKTFDSTEGSGSGSLSRSLPVQPSSEGSSSEPFPSDVTSRTALAAARAAASAAAAATAAVSTAKAAVLSAKTQAPYSERSLPSDPSSDSLVGNPCTGHSFTHKIGHGRLGFKPVSYIARHPCPTNYPNSSTVPGSSPDPVPGSRSGPVPGSGSGHVPGSRLALVFWLQIEPVSGSRWGPISGSRWAPFLAPDRAPFLAPDRAPFLAPDGAPFLAPDGAPFLAPDRAPFLAPDLAPFLAPDRAPFLALDLAMALAVAMVLVKALAWILALVMLQAMILSSAPTLLQASDILGQTWPLIMPPGITTNAASLRNNPGNFCQFQHLLPKGGYGRPLRLKATNHLDQVPSMQDGSESFYFRHGHQGLITLQLQSPIPLSTTQKDSYQPPRNRCQPIRGKREAMLEILLCHQICKEVQAEQELPRKPSEAESVTHHDYKKELVQAGAPAPTKPHDYCKEQPETFWKQRAPQLPGVSNIKTLDTPFRKNCSFSTPVPLSLEEPFPDGPENYSHQLGQISSLGCQGRGQVVRWVELS